MEERSHEAAMNEMITVRLDKDVARLLARVVKLSGRSQSDVVRDALRRQLTLALFDQMRRRVLPFAEARGLLTDEDVFEIVS
jgi:Arc/MetJ-type ribon-helix-helix transcriptional regulator